MASGHRRAPHPKAGHMAAPTSNSASGQQSSCQHGAVHTWRKAERDNRPLLAQIGTVDGRQLLQEDIDLVVAKRHRQVGALCPPLARLNGGRESSRFIARAWLSKCEMLCPKDQRPDDPISGIDRIDLAIEGAGKSLLSDDSSKAFPGW